MRFAISLACLLYFMTVGITRQTRGEDNAIVGWRNDGTGRFQDCLPPTNWSKTEQILWRAEMPRSSYSSPIVVGEQVFTLAEPGELVCVQASDGKISWRRSHGYDEIFPPEKAKEIASQHAAAQKVQERIQELQKQRTEAQKPGSPAADPELDAQIQSLQQQYEKMTPYPPPRIDGGGNTAGTPASDGASVFAILANGIVSSHKLDGTRNWIRFIEKPELRHTSSPLIVNDLLIVHLKHLFAFDSKTGETRWEILTPARNGTAVTTKIGKSQWIITPAGSVVRAADGEVVAEKLFDLAYSSPIIQDGIVYAVERGTIKAIQLATKEYGELEIKTLWSVRGAEDDRLASPVLHNGLLYSVGGKGILEVVDAGSGERIFRKRLDLGDGRIDSSLAIAGNQLFISNTGGTTLLLKPGREYEEISRSNLEGFSTSPFFVAGRVYLRAPKHLYCIGK